MLAGMAIRDSFLGEFEHELANTRKTLERVTDELWGWKPHPKSFSMGSLATHTANMYNWLAVTLNTDGLDLKPEEREPPCASRAEMLAKLDKGAAEARQALAAASDEALMATWTLSVSGKPVFSMPRAAVVRGMILNHIVHHRGQMTVYLRMNDIAVPALFGPTADEG
jgi:uncharacterized damage-inducible protein DinB